MKVTKRSGEIETYDVEKIHKVIGWAVDGISGVSLSDVAMNTSMQLYDGVPTTKIHEILIKSAADLISEDSPNYQYVAARLLSYHVNREVWGSHDPPRLYEHIKNCVAEGVYDDDILNHYSESEIHKLGRKIKHDRDLLFTYGGMQTLVDKYLIKNRNTGKIYETPQFAYMLIAMWAFRKYNSSDRFQRIVRAYNQFSEHKINLPTPVMCGVRTPTRQYSSCVLIDVDDSMESIFSSATAVGYYTARRAGIGLNMGRIRALGSPIRHGEVVHTGIVPFLKVMESTVKSCSQNGVRGGSATTNFPFWHYEIEDIMTLKDNSKPDDVSVRKLDYCVHFSKLFYERLINNEDITLFSPHEVPDLYEAFGTPEFDKLYQIYEGSRKLQFKKTMPARKIAEIFCRESIETGRIYLMNIDHVNSHSAWQSKVNMTNLCVEINQPTIPMKHIDDPYAEIGVCILAAINTLNTKIEEIPAVADTIVRLLDSLIDLQDYPVLAAENFCKNRRSLGVGISNLAGYLATNKVKYSDTKALELVDEYMESVQHSLLQASCNLAKELGPCSKFDETTYAQGKLPIDHYCKSVDSLVKHNPKCDWESLRKDIAQYGLRHSTVTAQMPCESSSVIQNSTNGIEPVRSIMSFKKSKMGAIAQLVPNFYHSRKYYTLAWDMKDNTSMINITAVMQKWMDMAISMNLYYNYEHYENKELPMSVVLKDMIYSYKMGIKTRYYLNTDDGDKSVDVGGCESGACAI